MYVCVCVCIHMFVCVHVYIVVNCECTVWVFGFLADMCFPVVHITNVWILQVCFSKQQWKKVFKLMSHSLESALKRLKGSAYIVVVYKCMHLYFHHVIRNIWWIYGYSWRQYILWSSFTKVEVFGSVVKALFTGSVSLGVEDGHGHGLLQSVCSKSASLLATSITKCPNCFHELIGCICGYLTAQSSCQHWHLALHVASLLL